MEAENLKVATFQSHYGAILFKKRVAGDAALKPVPRSLSSSCGTAVFFTSPFNPETADEYLEAVYKKEGVMRLSMIWEITES